MNENATFNQFPSPPSGVGGLDFIIVGQGICGTFLSYYLSQAGKKVLVIDDDKPFTASKVASGVINPVTGRRIVRTWMIEALLPFAADEYEKFGRELGVELVKKVSVLDFHPTLQMKEAFEKRRLEETEYLHKGDELDWKSTFNFHFGVGEISPCLLIDIHVLLASSRAALRKQKTLLEETFYQDQLNLVDSTVSYKHLSANKIIFCDGVSGLKNSFFKNLPYSANKGEALIVRIPALKKDYIYKQGLSIVPWKNDLSWIGSTYEWDFKDLSPSVAFKDKVIQFLNHFVKGSFEIVDHIASVRPANMERRPFVGLHPNFPQVGILNGMGTKGCSLAPFFAKQFAGHLVKGTPISPEADVKRFIKILARKMN